MTRFDLNERVAVISGASRGIGQEIARAFVSAGARVVISSRKAENIQPVAAALDELRPDHALAVVAHAGKRDDAIKLIASAVEQFGRVDIIVNNAATNPHFGPLLAAEEWQWDKILEVNLKGYFWLCQAAVQQMLRQPQEGDTESRGKIINMASVAGIKPGPMMGIYSISKAGVIMMTKALAVELGADKIQVNAIAPGFVKTRFSKALWDNPMLSNQIAEQTPAGRMATPDEISEIALYLASPNATFTTGAVFTVDGGFTLT